MQEGRGGEGRRAKSGATGPSHLPVPEPTWVAMKNQTVTWWPRTPGKPFQKTRWQPVLRTMKMSKPSPRGSPLREFIPGNTGVRGKVLVAILLQPCL